MQQNRLHVVIGAGPLGLAVARELHRRGKAVRVICRSGRADLPSGIEVLGGDITDTSRASGFCHGASVIYHCANVDYARWPADFPPVHRAIIDCAKIANARLIFGDNLYAYGPVDRPLTEDLPPLAPGPNGRVRAEMAQMVMDAHASGAIRAAIGRGSDFFGPHVRQSHAGERLFTAALRGKPAQILGNPDMPHTYTFIDDFARGLVVLGENDRALGEIWHIPSATTLTTRAFVELVYATAGNRAGVTTMPQIMLSALALMVPVMRAVKEQMYQLERPFVVDHAKFATVFGDGSTPHHEAIRSTLQWYKATSRS